MIEDVCCSSAGDVSNRDNVIRDHGVMVLHRIDWPLDVHAMVLQVQAVAVHITVEAF